MTQILRQSTQIKVVIGPVVAVGDGFTPVTTLDLSTADEAEIIKSDAAAVTSISAATFAAIANADGYYNLTLTTSFTDTCGLLTVLINDDSLCLPVKATFMVVEEAIYDALYAASANGFAGSAGASTVTFANTSIATVTNLTNLPSITAGWLTATGIAADAFTAAKFAADFGTEMRTVLHGGDYAADMDANGRIRIVDGTGTGELDTLSGTVLLRAANEAVLADLVDGGRLDLLIDAIKAKTDSLTFTVANQVDSNALSAAGTAWGSGAITRASLAADTGLQTIRSNTAQSGDTSFIQLDTGASSSNNFYRGMRVVLTGGTGVGQERIISSYTGASRIASVDETFDTAPDVTTTFAVIPCRANVAQWSSSAVNGLSSGNVQATVVSYQSGQAPLQPTVAGRTLDVSATGEAGIDWANIGSPTTTVNLSGTTVKTATDIATQIAALNNITAASVVTAMGTGTFLTAIPWNSSWDAEVQSEVEDALGANGANLTAVQLADAEDVYHADIDLSRDVANTQDEYTVRWFKNGVRIASGITSPTIQVIKRADGTDLIASTAMTEIGSTGAYKYTETSSRISAGEAVIVSVAGTIDGSGRRFERVISRDST